MKTKIYLLFFIFFSAMLSFLPQGYAQDTSMYDKNENLTLKIQLLESKLELLNYKIQELNKKNNELETLISTADSLKKKLDLLNQNIDLKSFNQTKIEQVALVDTSVYNFIHAFSFNPFRLFEGTFQVNYEKAISDNLALEGTIMGTFITENGLGGMYLSNQDADFYDEPNNQNYYYDNQMLGGYGVIFGTKHYLQNKINKAIKAPRGMYVSPQLMYRKLWLKTQYYDYNNGQTTNQTLRTDQLDVFKLSAIIGYKGCISNVLFFDVFFGGAFRFSKYSFDDSLTKYNHWTEIDYTGISPSLGVNIGFLK